MEIIYISNLCSGATFEYIKEISFKCPSLCEQKYHRVLAEGLFLENRKKLSALSVLPISKKTCKKLCVQVKKDFDDCTEYHYISVFNVPIIKQLWQMIVGFFFCFFKCLKNRRAKIICDMLCGSVAKGARLAAKITKTEFTGIITDIPTFFEGGEQSNISNKLLFKQMRDCTSYVFLTETMNTLLNPKNDKAYRVIEGQANMNCIPPSMDVKYKKNVCIYAGAIERIYGIDRLVQAFLNKNIENAELHIYGDGDYAEELNQICQSSSSIKYYGVQKNELVVEEERKAMLLVNPRPSDKEYTRYSFPSKTMEYMASGTAVLTTNLPGIPKEYKEYVYMIEDESTEGIGEALEIILSRKKQSCASKKNF